MHAHYPPADDIEPAIFFEPHPNYGVADPVIADDLHRHDPELWTYIVFGHDWRINWRDRLRRGNTPPLGPQHDPFMLFRDGPNHVENFEFARGHGRPGGYLLPRERGLLLRHMLMERMDMLGLRLEDLPQIRARINAHKRDRIRQMQMVHHYKELKYGVSRRLGNLKYDALYGFAHHIPHGNEIIHGLLASYQATSGRNSPVTEFLIQTVGAALGLPNYVSVPIAAYSNLLENEGWHVIRQKVNEFSDYLGTQVAKIIKDGPSKWWEEFGKVRSWQYPGPFKTDNFHSATPLHAGWRYSKGFRFPRKHVDN